MISPLCIYLLPALALAEKANRYLAYPCNAFSCNLKQYSMQSCVVCTFHTGTVEPNCNENQHRYLKTSIFEEVSVCNSWMSKSIKCMAIKMNFKNTVKSEAFLGDLKWRFLSKLSLKCDHLYRVVSFSASV